MLKSRIYLLVLALLVTLPYGAGAAENAGQRSEIVRFQPGSTGQQIKGRIKGYESVDYRLAAQAGQTLSVSMQSSNRSNYFNISPPVADHAIFIGSTYGNEFTGVLPTDGDYIVSVYLMRNAARRQEVANYRLNIRLTGHPGHPPASDALVPGTPFHATASIKCSADGQVVQTCTVGMMRREPGAGTVEIALPNAGKRHIAFVAGQAVSSDALPPLTVTRQGDVSIIETGSGERFEIPDALVSGG